MKSRLILVVFAVASGLGVLSLGGCTTRSGRELGAPSSLGRGAVASYAELGAAGDLKAIGVVFSASALDALPTQPSDGNHCFDANNDGVIDLATECSAWHERVLAIPSEVSRRPDVPFKWALLNWNPYGHMPPAVFDKPHFDVHFYIEPIENVFALQRGTCGPEFLRCDQSATTLNISAGGTGSLTASMNVTSGFSGSVSFSCTGTPLITCTASPSILKPLAGQSATATITFPASLSARQSNPRGTQLLASCALLPAVFTLGFASPNRKRAMQVFILMVCIVTAIMLPSCGGGSNSGGGGNHGSNTYSVVVSSSASGTGTSRTLGTVTTTVTH